MSSEWAGGHRVTGTEESDGRDSEMGCEMSDSPIVGNEEGAMGKSGEKTVQIELVGVVLHLATEEEVQVVAFLSVSRIGHDHQLDLVVGEEGGAKLAKAIDAPPIGRAQH